MPLGRWLVVRVTFRAIKRIFFLPILLLGLPGALAQRVGDAQLQFAPLEQWRRVIEAGNMQALGSLLSTNPEVEVTTPAGRSQGNQLEVSFWKERTAAGLAWFRVGLAQSESVGPGAQKVLFEAGWKAKGGSHSWYMQCAQIWQQQNGVWKLVGEGRGEPARLPQPVELDPNLYSASADAHYDIQQGLSRAKAQHKNVLLDFGANWCYDCHVLDAAFGDPDLKALLMANFVLVHVDVGRADKNLDIAQQYSIPLEKGIPALAVLSAEGKLLYSQQQGEFQHARGMEPEEIVAFLKRWAPRRG